MKTSYGPFIHKFRPVRGSIILIIIALLSTAAAFAENDIDFRALPTLTEEDLKELDQEKGQEERPEGAKRIPDPPGGSLLGGRVHSAPPRPQSRARPRRGMR